MDLVEMAKLSEKGMIVINPDRHKQLEPTLENGVEGIWEQTERAILPYRTEYAVQEARKINEDYKD